MHAAIVKSTNRQTASPSDDCQLESKNSNRDDGDVITSFDALNRELDRLRKDKIESIYEIEHHKKRVTYAIMFGIFGIVVAICMVIWKFTALELSYEDLRLKVINTPDEELALCVTVYPKVVSKDFEESEVGKHLVLTDFIDSDEIEQGVELSRVDNVLQSETSYSGFLNVNKTFNSSLFFWFFPAKSNAANSPLLLWLEGGPGWPTMYAVFKENGPFLVGWDSSAHKSYLLTNKQTWTQGHNLLFIDNPVGTGFSFTDDDEGYPETDEEVAVALLEAIRQFMKLYPYMVKGAVSAKTPFFAFGQSYGGAYVVSLAHVYLAYRENDPSYIEDILLKGIGIGNGFISSADQSLYADYVSNLGYVSEAQYQEMKGHDESLLHALNQGNYSSALLISQKNLHYFVNEVMNLTNIYEFTFDQNYLTNHEYVCFLQQAHVRRGIHVGGQMFNQGFESYMHLNQTIMVSKKPWLEEVLERGGIEVLIYNGNLDVIVNVAGTNRVVNSLQWSGKREFTNSQRKNIWVWNERTSRGELAGYANEGGGLTYAVVRNAGHMVPISQPLWARHLVTEFTHYIPGTERFAMPKNMKTKPNSSNSFENCS